MPVSGCGLRIEREGAVGRLVFDRPAAGNAMDGPMMSALPAAWRQLDEDRRIRCIIVTGAGRAFQTGLDMRALAQDPRSLREQARQTRAAELRLTNRHLDVQTPVIAAVNGVCAGGGLHFVVDADLVIASERATFVDPHVSVGQASAWEAVGLMTRGAAGTAARLALCGNHERLDAHRAQQLGLVGEVLPHEHLGERARQLAGAVAAADPAVVRARRHAIWNALETGRTAARRAAMPAGW